MEIKRFISFHPKLAAAIDLALSAVMLGWLRSVGAWWVLGLWILFAVALSFGLIRLAYYPAGTNRWHHFWALTLFNLGMTFLLIFIDWDWSWRLAGIMFLIFPPVSFWLVPEKESELSFPVKPYRRWLFLMCALGVYGLWGGVGALYVFQILENVNPIIWTAFAAVITTIVSGWWWREYEVEYGRRFWLWLIALGGATLEMGWVTSRLPLGYLANGIIMTWAWYVAWLLARFSLSKDGISWKKQRIFFIFNALLFLAFLIFGARWK